VIEQPELPLDVPASNLDATTVEPPPPDTEVFPDPPWRNR
jgi:hypothetical protein